MKKISYYSKFVHAVQVGFVVLAPSISGGVEPASPAVEQMVKLEVDFLYFGEDETRREHTYETASFLDYEGAHYLAYGNNVFKFPHFPQSFEFEAVPLPDPTLMPPDYPAGAGYSLVLSHAQGQLFLSLGRAAATADQREDVRSRLFVLDDSGRFVPVYTDLIEHFPSLGRYSHLSINWLGESGGNLFTSAGGNLTVSTNAEGPYDFLWDVNGAREVIGVQRVFLEDRLVIQHGTNAIFQGLFLRSILNEQYDGWLEAPPDRTPPEIHEVLLKGAMEGGEIFVLKRQYGSGDLWGGQISRIVRSRDNGLSLEEVKGYFIDQSDPSDLTYDPVIRQMVFPTTHANQILIGGHESYGFYVAAHGRSYLGWSQDNGETWETLTPLLEDWDQRLTPIVFIHETDDGQLFAGRVIPREADSEGPFLEILRLTLPDPAKEAFPEADLRKEGWRISPSLGWIFTGYYPWVWIQEHEQWVHIRTNTNGFWALDHELGWYWSNEATYPYVYSHDLATYLYISPAPGSKRWIYRYSDGVWFQPSVNDADGS
jgi:hypothetical protein